MSQKVKRMFLGIIRKAQEADKAKHDFLEVMAQRFRTIPASVSQLTTQNIADSRGIITTVAQVFQDPTGEFEYVMQNLIRVAERQYSFSMDKDFKDLGVRHVGRQTRSKLATDLHNMIRNHLHLPEPYCDIIDVKIKYEDDDRFIKTIRVKTLPLMTREEMRTIIRQYISDNIDQVRDKSEEQLDALIRLFGGTTGGAATGGRKKKKTRGGSTGGASQAGAKKTQGGGAGPPQRKHDKHKIDYDTWQYYPQAQDIQGFM